MNKIFDKKNNLRISINLFTTITYFGLVYVLKDYLIWGVNDDFVLDQIINNKNDLNNSIVSFMTLFLGFLLSILTKLSENNYWLGLLIITSNWLTVLILVNIIIHYKSKLIKIISFFTLFLILPYLIMSPTYTITSILLSFTGLLLILYLISKEKYSIKNFLFAGFILSLGVSIRADSYKGIVIFLGLYLITFLYIHKQNLKLKYILWGLFPTIFVIFIQIILNFTVSNFSSKTEEYLRFQTIRHELFYTPAILKLHQNVIAEKVLPEIWGDVEFTLLRNWFYPDQNIYNSTNLKIGEESVKDFIGIEGFLNSDLYQNLDNLIHYLSDVKLILFIILIIFTFSFILTKNLKGLMILNFSLLIGYFMAFLYAASVLRLPIRVTFPYLILCGILISFNLELTGIKKLFFNKSVINITLVTVAIISIWFNFQKQLGFNNLLNVNKIKSSWAKDRDKELKDFSQDATYIGPIVHLPSAQTGPFLNKNDFTSLNRTLVLDWSTFSPSWRMQAVNLKLNPENIFNSLAKTKNVYLISEPGLASIIDMYMNDHEILRGKLCAVKNLTGYDNAKIYTFQAKENAC